MTKNEFHCLLKKDQEFSFGPMRWRSSSVQGSFEHASDVQTSSDSFKARLQALINQALLEGCSAEAINTILSQHTLGDRHVDA